MLYDGQKSTSNKPYNPVINNDLPTVTCTTGEKVLWIFLVVLTLGFLLILVIVKKNKFKALQNKINESASLIDVQLQKRYDTLVKLVSTSKSHVEFDKEVFTKIAAYRSGMDMNQKMENLGKISSALTMAFENYPTLTANESIRSLNVESIMIEKEIAASRRLYNSYVTEFNSQIYLFPNNAILRKSNYHGIPLFAAEESKRADINTSF